MDFERTHHRAQTTHLPHDPVHLLNVLGRPRRITEFALRVVLLGQVEQDGATLENTLLAVCHGRDAAVGVDLQEPATNASQSIDLDAHVDQIDCSRTPPFAGS